VDCLQKFIFSRGLVTFFLPFFVFYTNLRGNGTLKQNGDKFIKNQTVLILDTPLRCFAQPADRWSKL
jgi:hypothetical protein